MYRKCVSVLLLPILLVACAARTSTAPASSATTHPAKLRHTVKVRGVTHVAVSPAALTCSGLHHEVSIAMTLVKSGAYQKAYALATKGQNDASKPNPCKDDDYAEGAGRLATLDLIQSYAAAKLGNNDDAMAKYEAAEGDADGCAQSPPLHDTNAAQQCAHLRDVLRQNHDATMITLGNLKL